MRKRQRLWICVVVAALVQVSCWRPQKTGEPPRLPDPPRSSGKPAGNLLSPEQFGFFFVIPSEDGAVIVQLSESMNQKPPSVPRDHLRLVQYGCGIRYSPLIVLQDTRETTQFADLAGRKYAIMRNQSMVCQGELEEPRKMALLYPGSHEWHQWNIDPCEEPRSPLADIEKKLPLSDWWERAYAFEGAPLPCNRRRDNDDSSVLWARPAHMPPPQLLSEFGPGAPIHKALREEAARRVMTGDFVKKARQMEKDSGVELNIKTAVWRNDRTMFVETLASVVDGDCGYTWGVWRWVLWKVSDSRWEEIASTDSFQHVLMIGDFNEDGNYEIVIRTYKDFSFTTTFYQLDGLNLKKIMWTGYPSYETGEC